MKIKFLRPIILLALILTIAGNLSGCRGWRSDKPPIHPNPNLDWQAKYKAQSLSREIPEHTVAWGRGTLNKYNDTRDDYLHSNKGFYTGKSANGSWLTKAPIDVTSETLARGRERYNIYCSMCHSESGAGMGTVIKRGFVPPPSLSDNRIVAYKDGELFDVISNGIRNMPAYRKQIPEDDRWAIVTYVRALQKMHNAQYSELSTAEKRQLTR